MVTMTSKNTLETLGIDLGLLYALQNTREEYLVGAPKTGPYVLSSTQLNWVTYVKGTSFTKVIDAEGRQYATRTWKTEIWPLIKAELRSERWAGRAKWSYSRKITWDYYNPTEGEHQSFFLKVGCKTHNGVSTWHVHGDVASGRENIFISEAYASEEEALEFYREVEHWINPISWGSSHFRRRW